MELLNHHTSPLQLPSGQILQPNERALDPKWHTNKKSKALQRWIDAGIIQVFGVDQEGSAPQEDAPPPAAPHEADQAPEGQQSEEEQLRAELAKLGVKAHHKAGVDKLKAMLEQAKAEQPAAESVEGDADSDSGEDAGEEQ